MIKADDQKAQQSSKQSSSGNATDTNDLMLGDNQQSQQKQSSSGNATDTNDSTLGDDQIKAGFLLQKHWKLEHTRTIWHGLKDDRVAKIHSRFSTVLLCFLFLLKVAIILVNALTKYNFEKNVGIPVSAFMILFIWAASLSHDKPWQLKAAAIVSTLDEVYRVASPTFTSDDDETVNNNFSFILVATAFVTILMYTLFRKMVSLIFCCGAHIHILYPFIVYSRIPSLLYCSLYFSSSLPKYHFIWVMIYAGFCSQTSPY